MKTHLSTHRESYNVIPLQEISSSISIGDDSQIRLQATNVSSVGERMLTVGRNIKEAGCNAASWMANHPLEATLLAGGTVLASGSLLLGVGLSAKATACACSGFASSLSSNDTSDFTTGAIPTSFSFAPDATSDFASSHTYTTESTTVLISTFAPCLEPLTVNCSDLNPFSFTIAKGQGFALKESSENTLLLHKKPNTLVHDAEFTVDPKEFCVDGVLTEKAFSLHCDANGKDYLLSAANLQAEASTLETGACAVQTESTIKQYFDCSKSKQLLVCKENAKKACQNVQNFKLTIPPYKESRIAHYGNIEGSVFITEKGEHGKKEYRLFFTNYDKESKNLNVDVKADCETMLDVPLEFECSGKQSAKIGFTLRQNLTATDGLTSNFNAGACALQEAGTHAEKNCSIKFASRSECGGVLDVLPTCQDKMILLMSGEVPAGAKKADFDLYAMTPENLLQSASYLIERGSFYSGFIANNEKCHIVRRKVKPDYRLRRKSRHVIGNNNFGLATERVPKFYQAVNVAYGSLTFTNDTAILEGYERPCGFEEIILHKPEQQDKYLVPLCD